MWYSVAVWNYHYTKAAFTLTSARCEKIQPTHSFKGGQSSRAVGMPTQRAAGKKMRLSQPLLQ